jgi:hypothetical protein
MATASAAFTFTGASGSLARLDASASASVVATLDNLAGVSSIAWSVYATDETGGTYTLVASGPSGSICTFTSGIAGTAGILQCTINGGVNPTTGDVDATMTKRAKWQVKTAAGYDIGVDIPRRRVHAAVDGALQDARSARDARGERADRPARPRGNKRVRASRFVGGIHRPGNRGDAREVVERGDDRRGRTGVETRERAGRPSERKSGAGSCHQCSEWVSGTAAVGLAERRER